MTSQQISHRAYTKSSRRRAWLASEIVNKLMIYGPMTANEVTRSIPHEEVSHFPVPQRLLDLRLAGKVVVNRLVEDPITGHTVAEYRLLVPGETPPPVERRLSKKELVAENIRLNQYLDEWEVWRDKIYKMRADLKSNALLIASLKHEIKELRFMLDHR